MAEHIRHAEWIDSQEPTKYPFSERATMTNGTNLLLEGMFLDAVLYPIGGTERMYLSKVTISHQEITFFIGDLADSELASGTTSLINPNGTIPLTDVLGRPAGVLLSETVRLGAFQSWGVGTHTFAADQSAFVARVCQPTPAVGVRGFRLTDGSVLTGDVWLVGDDGIVLRTDTAELPVPPCGEAGGGTITAIRIDAVGDPLFRRRLCFPPDLFATPRFLKTLTFTDGEQSVVCGPDEHGDVQITVNNDLADKPVLRIRTTPDGVIIEAAGTELESIL